MLQWWEMEGWMVVVNANIVEWIGWWIYIISTMGELVSVCFIPTGIFIF